MCVDLGAELGEVGGSREQANQIIRSASDLLCANLLNLVFFIDSHFIGLHNSHRELTCVNTVCMCE